MRSYELLVADNDFDALTADGVTLDIIVYYHILPKIGKQLQPHLPLPQPPFEVESPPSIY